ncbi:MAG: glycosyltransferase involved in cell wall biosynthesis [Maribacter sp.]
MSVSTATYEECIQRGFDEKKMYVVPNGVDHDLIDLKVDAKKIKTDFQEKHRIDLDKRHIIVSLGRPVVRKGFSWFLENVLPRLDEDVLFIMIGPNSANKRKPLWKKILPGKWVYQINLFLGLISDEEKIMELLQKSGIKNKVVRTGAIPFNEVMGLLELADLFVMPNVKVEGDAEGFGLVALEASLRKTPVLASNMEGITEAIKNAKNGYLLPSEDATAWSEKIKTLLANKEGLTILGKQFSQFTLNTFGWDKMVEGYIDVFEKVIADRKDA